MSYKQKVVWSEGMFLRPQHFQQETRYLEFLIQHRAHLLSGHYWGFRSLELDEDALALGIVAIRQAEGVFPDGTAFSVPEHGSPPLELDVPKDIHSSKICLIVAPQREGMVSTVFERDEDVAARNLAKTLACRDGKRSWRPVASAY